MNYTGKMIVVSTEKQELLCFENDNVLNQYIVSTAKKGVGELENSNCTPRGWHKIHSIIGTNNPIYSVFVARAWTQEIFSEELSRQFPERDWILSRILRLEGMEPGRNQGGNVDTLSRFIYIHGTPFESKLGEPVSHGCIRMKNKEIISLANWATTGTLVYIR